MTIRADANKLPFKNSIFDCIVSVETVDYLDAKKVFREYNRVLKKGGFLIFSTGNNHGYKKYIHRVLSSHRTFYRYSFDEIKSYLEEESFETTKCMGYNWIPVKRDSNSVLFGLFEFLENISRLSHFPRISPGVFFIAEKMEESNENSG
ncbi:MAG: class I SAM-dependent methyltransferase [Candidatus Thermoplasmatota archaeon]|nr:class I SAM-dependent methyltransferase [Candidatus Thermoplasmatota archaeon]